MSGELPDLAEPAPPLTPKEKAAGARDAAALARTALDSSEDAPGHVVSLLRYHWTSHPESAELNTLLAEAHARIVDGLDRKKDAERHRRHRDAGKFHAREALRADADRGAARYWLGQLLLLTADAEMSFGRMKEALVELQAAQRRDPACDHGGPDRMLGKVAHETPGLLGGSNRRAIEHFRASIGIAPEFRKTRLWLAETYWADNQVEKAREEASHAGRIAPRPGFEKEDAELLRQAETLLKKIG
jgi:tetratricopeptide (TPR) repeat protein